MTAEDIQTQFEGIIDDSLDEDLELQFFNEEIDMLLSERDWEFLKKVDQSQSFNQGDNYLTLHNLPADFGRPSSKGIFVGNDMIPYGLIPFEQRIRWKDITYRYYIDYANNQYAIMGGAQPGVIQFYYIKFNSPLVYKVDNEGVPTSPIFPVRFHPVVAYGAARKFFAVDQGDKSRSWDDRWDKYYTRIHDEMVLWDESLKSQGNQNAYLPVDLNSYPTIIDIDQP